LKFSVVISIYKNENPEYFDLALESIWDRQSVKPSQIVIVQDGEITTDLLNVLDRWKSKLNGLLNLIQFPDNRGLGAALKVGVEQCKYDIVARMDTDDIATSDRFSTQLSYLLENPDIDILGSSVKEISYEGVVSGIRYVPESHDTIVSCLWASPMIHPSIMFRRSRVLAAGNYDERHRRRQDYELWFRCAENGLKFHNLRKPLLHYRFGENAHKKQTPRLAWEQAQIGFKGSKRIGLPVRYQLSCFIPFVRSILPVGVQHYLYRALIPFDPRKK